MPLLPLLLLVQAAAPVAPAAAAKPVCVRAGDLPPAFAKWNAAAAPSLTIGAPYLVTGGDPLTMKWATGGPSARGGKAATASFTVVKAGTYRIGLSNAAWIDVVAKGKALDSVAHEHGPACTGLGKIVDFTLAPGRYTLQLAGMKTDTVRVMIVAR